MRPITNRRGPSAHAAAKGVLARADAERPTSYPTEELAQIVSSAYAAVRLKRYTGKSGDPTKKAALPYATAARLFGKMYVLLAETIARGYPPYVLKFTDQDVIDNREELGIEEKYNKKNLQDWIVLWNRALKRSGSFIGKHDGHSVTFHMRSADGARFVWFEVDGPHRLITKEYGEERTLSEILAALREERATRLSWMAKDLPLLSDDQLRHVVSHLAKSNQRKLAEWLLARVLWLFGVGIPSQKTAVAVAAVVLVAGAGTTLFIRLSGSNRIARYEWVGSGFRVGGESASTVVIEDPVTGFTQKLDAVGGGLVNYTVSVQGRQDSYEEKLFSKRPDGTLIGLAQGASGKWNRLSVLVPSGIRDGSYHAILGGKRFDLVDEVRAQDSQHARDPFGWVYHFAEIPTSFESVPAAEKTCKIFVTRDGSMVMVAEIRGLDIAETGPTRTLVRPTIPTTNAPYP